MDDFKEELNKKIFNPIENINSLKGFEIISEALVYKILDLFGRNSLLSMLYQIGVGPGEVISKRLKKKYKKNEFEIIEALKILAGELKEFYSIKVREIEYHDDLVRIEIENHCFLREPIKHRDKLKYGKSFCRVNKGYFETAFKNLLGEKIKKIEINFLENDPQKDICIEELNFYLK
ncbi:MAG: hypothetical protein ACFFAQ_10840 [Promethearchaeota archaeon]